MSSRGTLQAGCVAAALLSSSAAWDDANHAVKTEAESSSVVITRLAVPVEAAHNFQAESEMPSYSVARRGTATVDDAYRQFLSMAGSHGHVALAAEVDEMSFEEVTERLEALCVIDPRWCHAPGTCLRRDVLAYMTCRYMGCRPGLLTSFFFGMTRRYAHREMLYQKMIAPGAPATLVSGSELLSVVTRVSRRVEPRQDVQLTHDEIH